jgi:phospholipase/carboxylesterase
MKVVESATEVLLEPEAPANAAIIWLHGLGADGHDFVPIAPELGLPGSAPVRFVFPHADVRPVTVNGGMRMRAWYDILGFNRMDAQDDAGIRASAARVDALIDTQVVAGIPSGRIVLAGFSQGGAIALHAGLRRREALAGVMALSTYLPLEATVAAEATPAGRATPILMCHGRQDPVVVPDRGARGRDALRRLGVLVDWHDYPMAHEVCQAEIDDISRWLGVRLAPPSA